MRPCTPWIPQRVIAVTGLNQEANSVRSHPMKLLYAVLIYLVMGAVLGLGIVLAVKGSLWLLILSLIAFIIAFGRIGCLHH